MAYCSLVTCAGSSSSLLGCASLPRRGAAVDDLSVEGEQEIDEEDIEDKIATRKSPKFLALFRGVVYDYEIFNGFVLQRDLQRIERFDRLHLSCGPGLRLGTPVGPVRLDIGYRIPGLQTLGDATGEGIPTTTFGLPLAISIGVGEAF
jgi:outer membrane protein assembly factor BamA